MCHVSLTLTELESNCGKREFFMSDRNAFALNFLKFRVSTYLGLRLGIPILRMAKIRLWSLIDREYTPECTILSVLLVIKRSIRVEVLLVTLMGSLITCVNQYASIILMSRVVYESLESCRRLQWWMDGWMNRWMVWWLCRPVCGLVSQSVTQSVSQSVNRSAIR